MSFKNLNDAIFASGHSNRRPYHAPMDNKRCRRQAKAALHNVDIDYDEVPEMPIASRYRPRKRARSLLLDHWLKQQVGRPYEVVYSELRRIIGPITSRQAHDLLEGLEWDIAPSDVAMDCFYDYEVDENGILVKCDAWSWKSCKRPNYKERNAWTRDRKIFVIDGEYWWCEHWRYDRNGLRFIEPAKPLSPEDIEFFHSLWGFDQRRLKVKLSKRYARALKRLHEINEGTSARETKAA